MSQSTTLFEFGSRSGSYVALALFAVVFGALGAAIAQALRRRGRTGWRFAAAVGGLFFLGPVSLVYASSLSGFYGLRVSNGHVSRSYLMSPAPPSVRLAELGEIKAVPAFRGRWRLRLTTVTGQRFESATWRRAEIEAAVRTLVAMKRGQG